MSTEVNQLDTSELEQRVKHMYREVALEPEHEFHFETGRALAERLGYPSDELDGIPAAAIESFAGVGYFLDLAAIAQGEAVLDLGSGSGTDSFVAALETGSEGRVVGVDMTDAQLAKARSLGEQAGLAHVEFRAGYIEKPPVEDGEFDCVISNGVINLSPEKLAVFAAAARALRPGGRLALADIVSERQLPEGVTCDASLWAACIGGAMQRNDYRHAIETAGFAIESWRQNHAYRFVSERADNATRKYGVTSISLLARRNFFGRGGGKPFSNQAVSQRAARTWKAAGLEPIGLHDCRHTFASLMIAAGVNAKALSALMGHTSITMTLDRYGHLFPGSEDEAAGLLDAYLERAVKEV